MKDLQPYLIFISLLAIFLFSIILVQQDKKIRGLEDSRSAIMEIIICQEFSSNCLAQTQ